MKRVRQRLSGQGLVELALVLPFALWILLGVIDFGRVYYFSIAATNAAREGARYWASNPTASASTVRTRVQNEAAPQVSIESSKITLTNPTSDQVRVQVQYSFQPITPLVSTVWGGGALLVTTQAQMPVLAI